MSSFGAQYSAGQSAERKARSSQCSPSRHPRRDSVTSASPRSADRFTRQMRCRRPPLASLGLVSKSWRNQVETFCSHLLLVWKHEVDARRRCCEPSGWVGKRKLATYTANARMEHMLRMKNYCGVCGKLLRTLPSLSGGRLCCFDCKHGSRGEYSCSCSAAKRGN